MKAQKKLIKSSESSAKSRKKLIKSSKSSEKFESTAEFPKAQKTQQNHFNCIKNFLIQ
jgi:hypothetical protein